jgi:hypothetical protein
MKSRTIRRRTLLLLAGGFFVIGTTLELRASEMQKPTGPVVLTVTGQIGKTNRAAFDATQDLFFKYHDRAFERAFEFDAAMLESLGESKALITYTGWPQPVRVEGPLLRDVLAEAGAVTGKIRITALDGFATELDFKDLAEQNWIVALKADGRSLNIGQRGPCWVVYGRRDGKPATAEDEARWPWAAFLIEIE